MKCVRANLPWLLAYLLVMVGGLAALHASRVWALSELSDKQSQAAWESWRAETEQQEKGGGPVTRRKAKSHQPPTLVLLRDYYIACVALFVLLGSVLFVTVTFLLRGALATSRRRAVAQNSVFPVDDTVSRTRIE